VDPILTEFVKYGPFALLAAWLVWKTLGDKDRMSEQLNSLNIELRQLVQNNTSALVSVKDALKARPCLAGEARVEGMCRPGAGIAGERAA
jgi:hypothetical protein